MNRYLTILLVFITATGSEAQILTSALDVQCGNMRIEQMLSPEQPRTMGTDIMAVLKALNGDTDNTTAHTFYNHTFIAASLNASSATPAEPVTKYWARPLIRRMPYIGTTVSIRAPSRQ